MPNHIAGRWTYRSLLNNPDLNTPFDALRFGAGNLVLEVDGDTVTGTLGGTGWELQITGQVLTADPVSFLLEGRGDIGGEPWAYDYRGYLVPDWPNGVDQRDALVGSIIRVIPHSQGQAPAGFVASWYAARQD